ncbi:MAG: AraC family transcriptional regulator [Clostridia bacterium]|nr:AraC family transcriptional regulator [Clostridia bacterium]
METLRENVAYLQGLMEGIEFENDSKEGKIIKDIVNVLGNVADAVKQLDSRQSELEGYLNTIDEELLELEDIVYGNNHFVEVECPECHELVCFDADILEGEDLIEVTCPNCDSVVYESDGEFDFDEEEFEFGGHYDTNHGNNN